MRDVLVRILVPECVCRLCVWLLLLYRRVRFGYAFRRIPLTKGKFAIVDPDDYERLSKFKWIAFSGTRTFYALRWSKQAKRRKRHYVRMHRVIMQPPKGMLVDHINHNGLDNRKANLRLATQSQNSCNKRKTTSKTVSRYKGLALYPNRGKRWAARIRINERLKHLGFFEAEADAARAYDSAACKYHGEFAVLNFPQKKGRSIGCKRVDTQ